jgi:tetratricopeptide (TPR) repeat protein
MDKWNRICSFIFLLNLAWMPLKAGPAEGSTPNPPLTPPAPVTSDVTNAVTNAATVTAADLAREMSARFSDEAMRSYLHLQEQLHAAKLAIEQARLEASVEAESNLGAMVVRMESLEKELSDQRASQAESVHRSNRILIFAAAGIFLVGIVAIILTVILQARGMNRLAEIATGVSAARALPGLTAPLALSGGDRLLLAGGGAEANRLQSTISRLEGRIREIEVTAEARPEPAEGAPSENGPAQGGSRAALLGRVHTLMNLGQDEAALQALEEAIARHPDDATLHLRKGIVLERLKRQPAALESYEKAIALDGTCTQAYLAKGGILNQQERYQEALACFEHALANRTPSIGVRQS